MLYEQIEGVAMRSALGPLLANMFMCSIEETLGEKELPSFYKRYVGDTLTIMPDLNEAIISLDKLNSCHRNLKFTMEIAEQNTIPFVDMIITVGSKHQSTGSPQILVYFCTTTATWTSILKLFLLTIVIHCVYQLSSTPTAFSAVCNKLHSTFLNLDYPMNLINSVINKL